MPKDVPFWIEIALKELGIKEVKGGENQRIIEYHKTTSLKATEDEVPWCSAFVNWCMMAAGQLGTGSAAAKSWLSWGDELLMPQKYCVVVIKRGVEAWQAHVGFLMDWNEHKLTILGGNQDNKVSIKEYSRDLLLSLRWPKEHYAAQKNKRI